MKVRLIQRLVDLPLADLTLDFCPLSKRIEQLFFTTLDPCWTQEEFSDNL